MILYAAGRRPSRLRAGIERLVGWGLMLAVAALATASVIEGVRFLVRR